MAGVCSRRGASRLVVVMCAFAAGLTVASCSADAEPENGPPSSTSSLSKNVEPSVGASDSSGSQPPPVSPSETETEVSASADTPKPTDCSFLDVDKAKDYLGDDPILTVDGQDVQAVGDPELLTCGISTKKPGTTDVANSVLVMLAPPDSAQVPLIDDGDYGCSLVSVDGGAQWTVAAITACPDDTLLPDGAQLYLAREFDTWTLGCATGLLGVRLADLTGQSTYSSDDEQAFVAFCDSTLGNLV